MELELTVNVDTLQAYSSATMIDGESNAFWNPNRRVIGKRVASVCHKYKSKYYPSKQLIVISSFPSQKKNINTNCFLVLFL